MSKKPVLFTIILIISTVAVSLATIAWVGLLTTVEPEEWQMWLLRTIIYAVITSIFVGILAPVMFKHYGDYRERKKIFKALCSEVECNLNTAKKLLPIAQSIGESRISRAIGTSTIFDLQRLHTHSYEDFRRSGHLLSLKVETRLLLEEVYELIFSHNNQTNTITHQEISDILSLIPRIGGYSERLETLTKKLELLKNKLEL